MPFPQTRLSVVSATGHNDPPSARHGKSSSVPTGGLVGVIVGYATQRYGAARAQALAK